MQPTGSNNLYRRSQRYSAIVELRGRLKVNSERTEQAERSLFAVQTRHMELVTQRDVTPAQRKLSAQRIKEWKDYLQALRTERQELVARLSTLAKPPRTTAGFPAVTHVRDRP